MPDGARHGTRRSVARLPILAVVAAALIAGVVADRSSSAPTTAAGAAIPPVPVAAPAAALSSSWFCAGATDDKAAEAPAAVVISNSALTTVHGYVTLVPSAGHNAVVPFGVGPDSRAIVPEKVRGGSPWIGAIVDVDAGAVAVAQQIDSALGPSTSPCATAGSNNWYFATGATLINSGVVLSLLNPYPTAAVVDLTFTTNEGIEQPSAFQGMVIPADGLIAVNLRAHLRRRQFIATTVTSRSGRVVAWKTDVVTPPTAGQVIVGTPAAANPLADPAAPVPGVTVTLGSPSPGTSWVWPDGAAGNGIDERYVIYNPGTQTAQVELSMLLDEGTAEPFDLSIGPGQVTSVISGQEARIPAGVGHAAVLTSTNGVPVVAERTVAAGSPSSVAGLGEMAGEQLDSAAWLVPSGVMTAHQSEWLSVYNPGRAAVGLSIEALAKGRAGTVVAGVLTIGAGKRWSGRVDDTRYTLDEPLVVSTTGPVYVEADLYLQNGNPGVGLASGVPFAP